MNSRRVSIPELREGLAVQYLGDEPDRIGVLSPELVDRGVALFPGHPGRIWDTTVQHVQVTWVGLEEEPATFAVGFSTADSDRSYPGLGHLSETEFVRRSVILDDVLASGEDLSDWAPPW